MENCKKVNGQFLTVGRYTWLVIEKHEKNEWRNYKKNRKFVYVDKTEMSLVLDYNRP